LREIESILIAYDDAQNKNTSCILATVVHVEGSSYRRAGARMLVDENGMMTGAISGGCLEGDALRKALHALHQNKNKLVTYDTSDENDAVIGAQLGCNGVIQVLFEPIDFGNPQNPMELLKRAIQHRERMAVVTLFHLNRAKEQPGTVMTIDQKLNAIGVVPNQKLLHQIKADAEIVLSDGTSLFREYIDGGEKHYLFFESFAPPPTLVLVGAGNDAQILAQMAEVLGWKIIVTDGRPTHANNERFTSSCQVIVSKSEQVIENVKVNSQTVFVLMTHNYHYDLSVLRVLLDEQEVQYIGILGPRKKFQRMLDELKADGIELTDQQLSKIYAPVGLEIGAETPAEIGLSILSEIQAVLASATGSFLKEKDGPIHRKKNNEFKSVTLD
jgi:xanthine/CO dehydrogenase XdhC/CoxF family maturation factor